MGDALRRGMVLTMSIWDDYENSMEWLDGCYGTETSAGYNRGPCCGKGDPKKVESDFPNSFVKFSNIKFGPINTTFTPP